MKVQFDLIVHIRGEAERERLAALVHDLKTNPALEGKVEVELVITDDKGETLVH